MENGRKKEQEERLKKEEQFKKMMLEREQFFTSLTEIAQLKLELAQMEAEARQKEEALKDTKIQFISFVAKYGDSPPGKEIVFQNKRCQCFHQNETQTGKLVLQQKEDTSQLLSNEDLVRVFLIMSMENNASLADCCFRILSLNILTFAPNFRQIISVFLNWGATCESLNFSDAEKTKVFCEGICTKEPKPDFTFSACNYTKVFEYIGEVCLLAAQRYTTEEKNTLLKCLVRLSLDKQFSEILACIKDCIGKVVESYLEWDNNTVVKLCRLIHDNADHFHNEVYVALNTVPQMKRGDQLLSCMYFCILHILVHLEPHFEFPYEDKKIIELLKTLKISPDQKEQLCMVYITIDVVTAMVKQRNLQRNDVAKLSQFFEYLTLTFGRTLDAEFAMKKVRAAIYSW